MIHTVNGITFGFEVPVHPVPVPVTHSWDVRKKRIQNALLLCDHTRDGDDVIGHSNGCGIIAAAMELGRNFRRAWFLSAALNDDWALPHSFRVSGDKGGGCERLFNRINRYDRALRLGARLPFHRFGLMGKSGYQGDDSRIVNIPCHHSGGLINHNFWFKGPWLKRIAKAIAEEQKAK